MNVILNSNQANWFRTGDDNGAVATMNDAVLVAYCTCPDTETAANVSRALVERRLAACVNTVAGVRSYYRWQGRVEDAAEVLLIIKTVRSRMPALTQTIRDLHPYDVPELIAAPIEAGLPAYLNWVRTSSSAG